MSFSDRPSSPGRRFYLLAVIPAVLFLGGRLEIEPAHPEPVMGEVRIEAAHQKLEVEASVVALSWEGPEAPDTALVRVSEDGANWGAWTEIHDTADHGPDPGETGTDRQLSEGVYVGEASWVELSVEGAPDRLSLIYLDTSGRSRPAWERISGLIGRIGWRSGTPAMAAIDQPPVQPRSVWGGEACVSGVVDGGPRYSRRTDVMIVHHTIHSASANEYTAADVPSILYAICQFHVTARGWIDIGYNVVIDKFGTIWEGRAGGLGEGVVGAHSGGFNTYSTGVAFLGDHRYVAPPIQAQDAFVSFATWKLDVHHIDPLSVPVVRSLGSTRFAEGEMVPLRAISGHIDVSTTSCPGDQLLALIDGFRARVAASGAPKIFGGKPLRDPIVGAESTGYETMPFPFWFTETMSWSFRILDSDGVELVARSGTGDRGEVTWDGTFAGKRLPYGFYTAELVATPTSGAPAPRPARFLFKLGHYNPPFFDDDRSPHEADINRIHQVGITTGCGVDTFCPAGEVSRWEMALFLTRLHEAAGYPPFQPGSEFTDLGGYSEETRLAIERLAAMGVTTGTGEGTFGPAETVTRRQMALFLTRLMALDGVVLPDGADQGFTDLEGLDPATVVAINQLAQMGVTTGIADGLYGPAGVVTREQMASFLTRTLAKIAPTIP